MHTGERIRLASGRIVLALTACVVAVLVAGCETQGEQDPTPVKTFKITPAAQSPTAAPGAAASPTAVASAGPSPAAGALRLAASGQTLKFDTQDLAAAAGPITIAFDNGDAGVIHNLHVFEGTDAKGRSVGQTDLEVGPVTQELRLDLSAGRYYFQCDAHPATMKGALTAG